MLPRLDSLDDASLSINPSSGSVVRCRQDWLTDSNRNELGTAEVMIDDRGGIEPSIIGDRHDQVDLISTFGK